MKPILQSELHEQVLPALISGLKDPIPRVQAHAAASVTNFVEGMASLALRPYLTSLLTQFFNMIRDGSSLVKENAVSALAATAEASQEDFQGYFKQFVELLFETINSHRSNEYRLLYYFLFVFILIV